jgi:hypothetical protein
MSDCRGIASKLSPGRRERSLPLTEGRAINPRGRKSCSVNAVIIREVGLWEDGILSTLSLGFMAWLLIRDSGYGTQALEEAERAEKNVQEAKELTWEIRNDLVTFRNDAVLRLGKLEASLNSVTRDIHQTSVEIKKNLKKYRTV